MTTDGFRANRMKKIQKKLIRAAEKKGRRYQLHILRTVLACMRFGSSSVSEIALGGMLTLGLDAVQLWFNKHATYWYLTEVCSKLWRCHQKFGKNNKQSSMVELRIYIKLSGFPYIFYSEHELLVQSQTHPGDICPFLSVVARHFFCLIYREEINKLLSVRAPFCPVSSPTRSSFALGSPSCTHQYFWNPCLDLSLAPQYSFSPL